MTSVDRVKSICKTKNIPISRLERDLGFANGYIGQLKKGVFPDDRLVLIARYLEVSVAELTGEQNERPTQEGEPDVDEILDKMSIDELLDLMAKVTERLKGGSI